MLTNRIPLATYRLQFNKGFTFKDACEILDYLKDLGITDIYASPILTSRRGSGHGYDVTDPTRVDPDLGTEEDFEEFLEGLRRRDMGLLLDIVPNHMAASSENPWWMDVLENGPESAFASYFDIDWHPPSRNLDGRILLPVLGRPFGEVLDSAELRLAFNEGKFVVEYFDASFPLAPKSYRYVLSHRAEALKSALPAESAHSEEYQGIVAALTTLAGYNTGAAQSAADKRLQFEAIRERLRQLARSSGEIAQFIQDNLKDINGTQQDPSSFNRLERLLAEQYYALVYWQNVNETINYRRFFTITDLVGMRVEDPHVFEATHSLVLRLAKKDVVAGLRIDYLKRLHERLAVPEPGPSGSYVVVEKILERGESLPPDWPISGTTGYDYLNLLNRLFVHPEGATLIERTYSSFVGRDLNFTDVLYQKKKLIMTTLLGVEMRSLGRQLGDLAGQDRYAQDLPRYELTEALIEVTAALSIYRTYIRNLEVPAIAKHYLSEALKEARDRRPHLSAQCYDFVRDVLMLQNAPHVLPDQREARLAFVMRWQQFTGPIVAKGLEDTALYVYHPLLSLNEVGGDPRPGRIFPGEFDDFIRDRRRLWPHSLNASSTHDTKRSEDNRARISVLSEMPAEWEGHLRLWAEQNAGHKIEAGGAVVPDRNEEYFLYQTLLGFWPLHYQDAADMVSRLQAYTVKATREAMVHTRWTRPNLVHENALTAFVAAIVDPEKSAAFLESFALFQKKVALAAMFNSLAQTLIKIISPGVPDFYQGSDLWDFRLVDPDNRGPIDYPRRMRLLQDLQQHSQTGCVDFAHELLTNWTDGRIKLYVIWKALAFRQQHADLFSDGDYKPLQVIGEHSNHVIAFLRHHHRDWAVVIAPRWLAGLEDPLELQTQQPFWKDTFLSMPGEAPSSWRNIFTGEDYSSSAMAGRRGLSVSNVFKYFPLAIVSASSP
jgi:(1->4)-alpha-D-glucan 1-alpha-D-glucosylmutase